VCESTAHLAAGNLDAAAASLDSHLQSPCEDTDPPLESVAADHRIACLHYDEP
jgi:hypothetical protein